MNDKLQQICTEKREHVAKAKAERPFATVDRAVRGNNLPIRGFAAALREKIASGKVGLITEIKKASPSAGLLRPVFDPAELAKAYESGGAACLSVLTDSPYFQGRNDDLIAARSACNLPVLRKDFMVDVWQIAEARAIGADCVLLIMAALDDHQAADFHAAATDYGMDVLIETHNHTEMERALCLPSGLIGINNRNLKTLKTDLTTTEELAPMIPRNRIGISESGIATPADIKRMTACNISCFLIGESLLRHDNVAAATRALCS